MNESVTTSGKSLTCWQCGASYLEGCTHYCGTAANVFIPMVSTQPCDREEGRRLMLSADFEERLQRFATFERGWDGDQAEPFKAVVLDRARSLAERSLAIAGEPWCGPAGDGSILLEWKLPNGREVDYYVEDEQTPDAAVSRPDGVHEVHVDDEAELLALLVKEKSA